MLRLRGLSAAVSGCLRRRLSTAASRPPWALIDHTKLRPSSAQRASIQLAEPPAASNLVVPDHLVGLGPEPHLDPDSDIIGCHVGNAGATSGDGLLLLDFQEIRATAPVVATHDAAQQSKLTGFSVNLYSPNGGVTQERQFAGVNLNRDVTHFVCNPLSGQLFRLPDIDGTTKTASYHKLGLLTRSAQGHGPPERYAVAELIEERDREKRSFVMRRFLSETGEWEKLVGLPSPLPLARLMDIHTHHEVLAFAGRLWWIDLSWGAVSADPFIDRPELRFVELPRGSVLPVHTTGAEFTASLLAQGMYRRMGVSEGRLHYVEVSQNEPFVLSSFALDDDGSCWTLEHQVALGRLWANKRGQPWQGETPWIGAIDPLNASVVCIILGDHVLAVDMDTRKVLGCSHLGQSEYQQRTILITYLLPCVLPPWLGSSRIPSAGKKEGDENMTLADVLVRSGRD